MAGLHPGRWRMESDRTFRGRAVKQHAEDSARYPTSSALVWMCGQARQSGRGLLLVICFFSPWLSCALLIRGSLHVVSLEDAFASRQGKCTGADKLRTHFQVYRHSVGVFLSIYLSLSIHLGIYLAVSSCPSVLFCVLRSIHLSISVCLSVYLCRSVRLFGLCV